ncbi:MAG TPA: B12-binding domain-containing protein [Candidatus Nitrosopolaris sp.]|nr:B12-binding domain-containing protein [Candidatus Nitrosopolaris sp.]
MDGNKIVYRRYTLEEIKRKIISLLQNSTTGLSGVELASATGTNRMTITKYLNVLATLGLIKKKKVGSVNVWFVAPGTVDYDYPISYLEVQQKFMNTLIEGDSERARNILIGVINADVELLKILTDVIVPTVNTINELYKRGRLGKTERIFLLSMVEELLDLLKFHIRSDNPAPGVYSLFVAASEDYVCQTKIGKLAFQILGLKSSYVGDVGREIDPFFDIDFQRYISKFWDNKRGLLIICIYSSEEGASRFLYSAADAVKAKLNAEVRIVFFTTPELENALQSLTSDYVATNLNSLIEWFKQEYPQLSSETTHVIGK